MDAHLDNAYAHVRPSVVGRPQSSFNALSVRLEPHHLLRVSCTYPERVVADMLVRSSLRFRNNSRQSFAVRCA